MKKVFLFFGLIISFVLGVNQHVVCAQSQLEGKCGDNATYKLVQLPNGNYNLIISGTGEIYDYGLGSSSSSNKYSSLAKSPWHCFLLENVTISEGITKIGSYNFVASKAINYNLPSSLKIIGYGAFYEGVHQDVLKLPEGLEYIEDEAFKCIGCSWLNNVQANAGISSDLGYVKDIYFPTTLKRIGKSAFGDCDSLERIDINGDTVICDSAFKDCDVLSQVNMNGKVTRVEGGNYEFYNCPQLKEITLSDTFYWNDKEYPYYVSGIGTFSNSLEVIKVKSTNLYYKIKDSMLYTKDNKELVVCPPKLKIEEYYIPEETEKIHENAFCNHESIKFIWVPKNVRELGCSCFYSESLRYLVLSDKITSIPFAIVQNTSDLSVYVPGSVNKTMFNSGKIYNDSFGQNLFEDRKITIYGDEGSYIAQNYSDVFKKAIYCEYIDNGKVIEKSVLFPGYKYCRMPVVLKEGARFSGWYTEELGGEKIDETTIFNGTESTKLYARWENNTYKIIYDMNGGSSEKTNQIKYHGKDVTISLDIPTKSGNEFVGWSTSSMASEPEYKPGDVYSDNKDITLYAIWKSVSVNIPTQTLSPTSSPITTSSPAPTSSLVPTKSPVPTSSLAPTKSPVPTSSLAPTKSPSPTIASVATLTPTIVPSVTVTPSPSTNNITESNKNTLELDDNTKNDFSTGKREAMIDVPASIKKTFGTKKFRLNVNTNSDGKIRYATSDKKVVTVDKDGEVTIKGYGKAQVAVITMSTNNYVATMKKINVSILPDKVKGFGVKANSKGEVSFRWKTTNDKKAKCQIQASLSSDFNDTKLISEKAMKLGKAENIKGLSRGKVWYFRTRAVVKVSGKKYYSNWVKTKVKVK